MRLLAATKELTLARQPSDHFRSEGTGMAGHSGYPDRTARARQDVGQVRAPGARAKLKNRSMPFNPDAFVGCPNP
jgi:hypothetical protein